MIELAVASGLAAVRDLIAAAGLPLDGLGEVPTDVFVARHDGTIVGTASLEDHEGHGLLRSVAVEASWQGRGIGGALTTAAEQRATAAGLDGVFLLTETAQRFFAQRGYEVIGRGAGPAPIMRSVEWSEACGRSAVAMVRAL